METEAEGLRQGGCVTEAGRLKHKDRGRKAETGERYRLYNTNITGPAEKNRIYVYSNTVS